MSANSAEVGGSVFPSHNAMETDYLWIAPGLSLRDLFALVAMHQFIKEPGTMAVDDSAVTTYADLGADCYMVADVMLEARAAKQ
jgi:hypothetical protein